MLKRKIKIGGKGISELVSIALISLMVVLGISIALTVGLPAIQRAKDTAIINEAIQNLKIWDSSIREVASEGVGSFRTTQLKVSGGNYKIKNSTNTIEFTYTMKSGILPVGTFTKDGNVILSSGVSAKASVYDLDGDGTSELVLENEIMKVGVLNNGTESNYSFINTTGLIKILNFIDTNANVTPVDSSIRLDDFNDSYYGNGYTKIIETGDHLSKAQAVAHVNSTNVVYDVIYTLQSSSDFLTVKIQNAYYK